MPKISRPSITPKMRHFRVVRGSPNCDCCILQERKFLFFWSTFEKYEHWLYVTPDPIIFENTSSAMDYILYDLMLDEKEFTVYIKNEK